MIAFTAFTDDRLSFRIGEVFDALLGAKIKFAPVTLVFGVDEAECMATESMHVAKACRNAAVAHNHCDLMQCLWQGSPEIPVVFSTAEVGTRVTMDDMVKIRKFERVAQKEDGRIIAHQIPVTLLGVEFKCKTADVTFGVSSTAFSGHGGKAREHFSFFADLGKDLGAGVFGDVVGYGEGTISPGALGVHSSLGYHLPVEMGHFSRYQTSCNSWGPRGPAVITFWLSGTGAPAFVVSFFFSSFIVFPFLLLFSFS